MKYIITSEVRFFIQTAVEVESPEEADEEVSRFEDYVEFNLGILEAEDKEIISYSINSVRDEPLD
jgi:hypothetical protein